MQNAAFAYLQTQVTTNNQGEILVMLYDGAIKFLSSAKERIAAKDPAGKGILISKAMDVLNELDSTLNMEKGGELAKNLHSLYDFCNRRLLMANLKQSAEIVDEVLKVLTGLRGAYAQILDNPEAQAAAEEAGRKAAQQSARTQSAPAPVERPAASVQPGLGRHAASQYSRQNFVPPGVAETPATVPIASVAQADAEAAQISPTVDPAVQAVSAASPAGAVQVAPDPSTPPTAAAAEASAAEAGTAIPPSFAPRAAAGLSMYRKFAGNG